MIKSSSPTSPPSAPPAPPPGPLHRIADGFLRLFSSIWLGVILLTILFFYSSIGSAGLLLPTGLGFASEFNWVQYHVRQYRGFEMTEFEWFHWWPFDLLIALICLNLVVATLRRIPFRVINFGVWMIHAGIIILALGSVLYFGTKLEGDTPIVRRRIAIEAPGAEPATLVALPGNATRVGDYRIEVASIDPGWEILSGDDAGERAYKVSVRVDGAGRQFFRELLAGYPQYTEDVIRTNDPAKPMARAIKTLGKPLVDEDLRLALEPHPQGTFFLRDSSAVHLREVGAPTWTTRTIRGLPRYNDYIGAYDDAWPAAGDPPPPLDPLQIDLAPAGDDDPLDDDIIVDRFLRYAVPQVRRAPGGTAFDPSVAVRLTRGGERMDVELVASDPGRNATAAGRLRFRRITDENDRTTLIEAATPRLAIAVPAAGVDVVRPIGRTVGADGEDVPFEPIPGTEYSIRVERYEDGLALSATELVSIAVVEVRSPERSYVRWAFDDPARSMDFSMDTGGGHGEPIETDDALRITYRPGLAEATIVAGPAETDLEVLRRGAGGAVERAPLAPGDAIDLAGDVQATVLEYVPRSRGVEKPAIVPRAQRQRNVGSFFSMIRVLVPGPDGARQAHWLRFQDYVYDRPDEALFRYPDRSEVVALPDGRRLQIAFGRDRRPLPEPVILTDFILQEHVGGYTGSTLSIRDWISRVRFRDPDGGWTEPDRVHVNNPIENGGYWYFQAQWDPPEPQRGSAGLNYTILGVGNRHGVNVMLFGCTLSVIGMIYAFYVKPLLRRRRRQAVYAAVEADRAGRTAAASVTEEVAS